MLDKEHFDVRFVPQGILFRLMQMCEHGSEEAFVATSIRNIMPELILGYFSRQKAQCWYYLVDKDYPPPYVFGKPLSITNPHIPTV